MSQCFKQPPHLTIAALAKRDLVPGVRTAAPGFTELVKARRTIFELDTALQSCALIVGQATENSHRVGPGDLIARMHETVSELSVRRE